MTRLAEKIFFSVVCMCVLLSAGCSGGSGVRETQTALMDVPERGFASLKGRLMDPASGRPVDGANVTLTKLSSSLEHYSTSSSPEGRYEFCSIPPGEYVVAANKANSLGAYSTALLRADEIVTVDLNVVPLGEITGTISAPGTPQSVPFVAVEGTSYTAVARVISSTGDCTTYNFRMTGVPVQLANERPYILRYMMYGYSDLTAEVSLVYPNLSAVASPVNLVKSPVPEAKTPPVADPGDIIITELGSVFTLDASASFDPDGGSVTYSWRTLPGNPLIISNPAAASFSQRATCAGAFGFALTVTDDEGVSSVERTVWVIVSIPPIPPSALAKITYISRPSGSQDRLSAQAGALPPGAKLAVFGGPDPAFKLNEAVVQSDGSVPPFDIGDNAGFSNDTLKKTFLYLALADSNGLIGPLTPFDTGEYFGPPPAPPNVAFLGYSNALRAVYVKEGTGTVGSAGDILTLFVNGAKVASSSPAPQGGFGPGSMPITLPDIIPEGSSIAYTLQTPSGRISAMVPDGVVPGVSGLDPSRLSLKPLPAHMSQHVLVVSAPVFANNGDGYIAVWNGNKRMKISLPASSSQSATSVNGDVFVPGLQIGYTIINSSDNESVLVPDGVIPDTSLMNLSKVYLYHDQKQVRVLSPGVTGSSAHTVKFYYYDTAGGYVPWRGDGPNSSFSGSFTGLARVITGGNIVPMSTIYYTVTDNSSGHESTFAADGICPVRTVAGGSSFEINNATLKIKALAPSDCPNGYITRFHYVMTPGEATTEVVASSVKAAPYYSYEEIVTYTSPVPGGATVFSCLVEPAGGNESPVNWVGQMIPPPSPADLAKLSILVNAMQDGWTVSSATGLSISNGSLLLSLDGTFNNVINCGSISYNNFTGGGVLISNLQPGMQPRWLYQSMDGKIISQFSQPDGMIARLAAISQAAPGGPGLANGDQIYLHFDNGAGNPVPVTVPANIPDSVSGNPVLSVGTTDTGGISYWSSAIGSYTVFCAGVGGTASLSGNPSTAGSFLMNQNLTPAPQQLFTFRMQTGVPGATIIYFDLRKFGTNLILSPGGHCVLPHNTQVDYPESGARINTSAIPPVPSCSIQ